MNPVILLTLIGNLIPLAGLFYWNWDPFQLLMLYWMETVIVAGWALARIGTLPENLLGRMTVNGKDQPATRAGLLAVFGVMAVVFCLGHFFILWFIFQDGWRGRVDGPASFVRVVVIESGAWAPLLFVFLASAVAFLTSATRPRVVRLVEVRILRNRIVEQSSQLDEATHGVGAAIAGLLGRIFIMQAAVIFGGMMARSYGSNAPMYIVIGLKLLSDLSGKPLGGGSARMQSKFGGASATQPSSSQMRRRVKITRPPRPGRLSSRCAAALEWAWRALPK